MEYVVLLYKFDVVEVGDLFVMLYIYNKFLSYKINSTESPFSFEIFSEHLWLIAKSKNSY